jgi:hypothetical protein
MFLRIERRNAPPDKALFEILAKYYNVELPPTKRERVELLLGKMEGLVFSRKSRPEVYGKEPQVGTPKLPNPIYLPWGGYAGGAAVDGVGPTLEEPVV